MRNNKGWLRGLTSIVAVLFVGIGFPLSVCANSLWEPGEFKRFCDSHEDKSEGVRGSLFSELKGIKGISSEVFDQKIIEPSLSEINAILQKSIDYGWSSIDLFTDINFVKGGSCSVFISSPVLGEVDGQFNLHTLWMIKPPLSDGNDFAMSFLLVGNGQMIIGYPILSTKPIEVGDYPIATGVYDYEPFSIMAVKNGGLGGKRGLFDIKVKQHLASQLSAFKGPLNVSIKSMEIKGKKVRVRHSLGTTKVEKLYIEKRTD